MKLVGFLLATASLSLLLYFWLTCGLPDDNKDLAACIFTNFLFGIAVPAGGVALWRADD